MAAKERTTPPPKDTRTLLKEAASELFAERGINGVGIRDIVAASGQKNAASVFYYFNTKDALIRELIADGAKAIDERYHACLDELEAAGRPVGTYDVVEVMIRAIVSAQPEGTCGTYLRFMAGLQLNHRQLVLEAVGKQWRSGFQRILNKLRELLPHLPKELLSERFAFMTLLLQTAMANWEAAQAAKAPRSVWKRDEVLLHLAASIDAMLNAPLPPQGTPMAAPAPARKAPKSSTRTRTPLRAR